MKLPETFVPNSKQVNVIIETPKGSGNKYAFDPDTELFKLTKILPQGLNFPLHFNFILHTKVRDVDKYMLREIINFFVTYSEMSNKGFKVLDNKGSQAAIKLIKNQITHE